MKLGVTFFARVRQGFLSVRLFPKTAIANCERLPGREACILILFALV